MKKLVCIFGLLVMMALFGCKNVKQDNIAALVNNEPIFGKEIIVYEKIIKVQSKGVNNEKPSYDDIINKLIENKIMLQEAAKLKITVSDKEIYNELKAMNEQFLSENFKEILRSNIITFDDWKKHIKEQMMFEKVMSVKTGEIKVTDKEKSAYYYAHIKDFTFDEMVRAYQILVRTETEILEVKKNLENGDDFQKIAKNKSISPESEKGGDLGYFSKNEMPPEIVDAVFKLPAGKLSGIIKTSFGYHIFKAVDRKKRGTKSIKDAELQISEKIITGKKEKYFKEWIKELRKNAIVKINNNCLEG